MALASPPVLKGWVQPLNRLRTVKQPFDNLELIFSIGSSHVAGGDVKYSTSTAVYVVPLTYVDALHSFWL